MKLIHGRISRVCHQPWQPPDQLCTRSPVGWETAALKYASNKVTQTHIKLWCLLKKHGFILPERSNDTKIITRIMQTLLAHSAGSVTCSEREHGFIGLPSAWQWPSFGHQRQLEPGTHECFEAQAMQFVISWQEAVTTSTCNTVWVVVVMVTMVLNESA